MPKYVVYVCASSKRLGAESSIIATLKRCGFERAMVREKLPRPLAPMLFIGSSSDRADLLQNKLELVLAYDTMCTVQVMVFPLGQLRGRLAWQEPLDSLEATAKFIN